MKKTVKIHVLHCGYIRISKDPDLPRYLTADDPDCVKVLCSHDPGAVHGATYEL